MDYFSALKIRALKAVTQPDREYFIRKTMRWYSRQYHTPLSQVEEIPLEDIFVAYFEEQFEGMDEEAIEAARMDMLIPEEERRKRQIEEDADDADAFEEGKRYVAEEERLAKEKAAKKLEAQKSADPISVLTEKQGLIRPINKDPELTSKPPKLLPGISMSFVDPALFDEELEGLGAMDQPKKEQSRS